MQTRKELKRKIKKSHEGLISLAKKAEEELKSKKCDTSYRDKFLKKASEFIV